jgi:transcriptional regulator with XRE-family HTH domain
VHPQLFTNSRGAYINGDVPHIPWREADVIHALRIECGWLSKDLAKRAGLNRSVVYRIEDGSVRDPKPKTLEKLAGAFGMTLRELRAAVPPRPIVVLNALPASRLNVKREAARIEREVKQGKGQRRTG